MLILVVFNCVHVSFLSFEDVFLACFGLVRLDLIVLCSKQTSFGCFTVFHLFVKVAKNCSSCSSCSSCS